MKVSESAKIAILLGVSFAAGAATLALGRVIRSTYFPKKSPFATMNRSTSGARTVKDLPYGKHAIQLYSQATPNGQKITIALEELGVPYDAFLINIAQMDQFTSGFVAINPNSKIPAMIDKEGPDGKPIRIFESGSILLYLADKYKKLIPVSESARTETLNWLFFQVGAGPYFGQLGHFYKYAPENIPYGIDRYTTETKRILDVLNKHLDGKNYLVANEYTIADIAWWPWVKCLDTGYGAAEHLGLSSYKNVDTWLKRCMARPKSKNALKINSTAPDGIKEFHS